MKKPSEIVMRGGLRRTSYLKKGIEQAIEDEMLRMAGKRHKIEIEPRSRWRAHKLNYDLNETVVGCAIGG